MHQALAKMLLSKNVIDRILPDAPDIDARWQSVAEAYLPDGVREFAGYPTVSLGWMMFIGMAVAKMWDEDWTFYSGFNDIYGYILRKGRGYDNMDEYICEEILKLRKVDCERVSNLVGDSAQLVHSMLMREGFEAGTPEAYRAYVGCLHQLYYFGSAVELRRLGYHMTELK